METFPTGGKPVIRLGAGSDSCLYLRASHRGDRRAGNASHRSGPSRHVELISGLIYDALPEEERETINRTNLEYAAIFHDLGKLGMPEEVLNKPGKLTSRE